MANASAKRQAISNKKQLTMLHNVSYFIFASTFIYFRVAGKHFWRHLLFASPAVVAEILLDRWCRPKYRPNNALISAGIDINQSGLVDYMKDLMMLNWFVLLLSVAVGAKAWFLMLVIPVIFSYKALQLLKAAKHLMAGQNPLQTQSRPA